MRRARAHARPHTVALRSGVTRAPLLSIHEALSRSRLDLLALRVRDRAAALVQRLKHCVRRARVRDGDTLVHDEAKSLQEGGLCFLTEKEGVL